MTGYIDTHPRALIAPTDCWESSTPDARPKSCLYTIPEQAAEYLPITLLPSQRGLELLPFNSLESPLTEQNLSSCTITISKIAESVWNEYEKQRYFHNFLRDAQSKVLELINDYSINSAVTRDINETMRAPVSGSSMLYDNFKQVLSTLVKMSERYLDMPIAPFSMAVTQLLMSLHSITKKIANQDSLPDLDKELRELHVYALNRLGVSPIMPDCGDKDFCQKQMRVRSFFICKRSKNKTIFLTILQNHFNRLEKSYYEYLKTSSPNSSEGTELFYSFIQLIMECGEYLESHSRTAFSKNIHNFKVRLDYAWLNLKNSGNMNEDLKDLQMFIYAAKRTATE